MSIKVTRNATGNCINFVGSSQPAYWNACLSAQINVDDASRIDVINDVQTAGIGVNQYEFYAIPFVNFTEADGTPFSTVQDAVDYITANANVIGVSDIGADLTGTDVNFRLDETATSVILDNGSAYGVNTLKAVAEADGTVHIHAIGAGNPNTSSTTHSLVHFEKLEVGNVYVNGILVSGGIQTIANTLNELFTVGPFDSVIVSDPFSTILADAVGIDVSGSLEGSATDPTGVEIGAGVSTHSNESGYKSVNTIDQPGEYFTFDIKNEGIIGFGLVLNDLEDSVGDVVYANPATFCTGVEDNGHYGFQYSNWFHPTTDGPWTNSGASIAEVRGVGWDGHVSFRHSSEGLNWRDGDNVKIKVGLDESGFIAVSYLDVSTGLYVLISRSSYSFLEGVKFHLGIKFGDDVVRLVNTPKVHLLDESPVMQFRYIESPDGLYDYPLFATEEEVIYYDMNHNGTVGGGTFTQTIYVDDPTQKLWYKPDTGFTDNDTTAPTTGTFLANPITWTEITSLTNADLVPSAFSINAISFAENDSVNLQISPSGASFTTTVSGLPEGLSLVNTNIVGTTRYVASEEVHAVTVTRTNTFGSASAVFTITITYDSTSADLVGWAEYGADSIRYNPNTVPHYSGNFSADFEDTLSPGEEYIWTQTNGGVGEFLQMGIVSFGVDKSTTVLGDTVSNWDLKLTNWTDKVNHVFATGWTDNSVQATGSNDGVEFKISFPLDNGPIELHRGGTLLLTSSANFSGAQTFTVAVPEAYTADTQLPSITKALVGAGTLNPPAGFNSPLLAGQMSSTLVMGYVDDSVAELTEVLDPGKRIILPKSWVESNILPHLNVNDERVFFGVPKSTADYADISLHDDFDAVVKWETLSNANNHKSVLAHGGDTVDYSVDISGNTDAIYDYAIEWDGTDLHVIACNTSDLLTEPGVNAGGYFTRVQTFTGSGRTGSLPLVFAVDDGGEVTLNLTGVSVIDIPVASAGSSTLTVWGNAIQMSGSDEYLKQGSNSGLLTPFARYNPNGAIAGINGKTSAGSNARPHEVASVFEYTAGKNAYIISQSIESTGSSYSDKTLWVDDNGQLRFKFGSFASNFEAVSDPSTPFTTGYYGLYMSDDGGAHYVATEAKLLNAFRFKLVNLTTGDVTDIPMTWTIGGYGNGGWGTRNTAFLTIGRRHDYYGDSNAEIKMASLIVSTLTLDITLPDDAQVSMMVRDPLQWEIDYKIGKPFRVSDLDRTQADMYGFGNTNNEVVCKYATQIWLMGNGLAGSPSIGVLTEVFPSYPYLYHVDLFANSMVSADFETVTIPGLT